MTDGTRWRTRSNLYWIAAWLLGRAARSNG
jgi:hypothetical protein